MTTLPFNRSGKDEKDLEGLQIIVARQMLLHALPVNAPLDAIGEIAADNGIFYSLVRYTWMEMKRDLVVVWEDGIGWHLA